MLAAMAAGGMGGRGGVPMSRRVRATSPLGDDGPARHCWVADAVDDHGVKRAGLLVEWRGAGDRWEGRVVYVAEVRPGRWVLVEEWVAAALLTPV
jgi:hypothetical protein